MLFSSLGNDKVKPRRAKRTPFYLWLARVAPSATGIFVLAVLIAAFVVGDTQATSASGASEGTPTLTTTNTPSSTPRTNEAISIISKTSPARKQEALKKGEAFAAIAIPKPTPKSTPKTSPTRSATPQEAVQRTVKRPAVKSHKKRSAVRQASYSGSSKGLRALAYARAQIGEPYRMNAAGPGAWDCSGLTMKAWGSVGVSLPHSARQQLGKGRRVSKSNLRKGDLVFFYSPIHHVGIYAGNGKVLHASRPGKPVGYLPMKYMPYAGAVRPG